VNNLKSGSGKKNNPYKINSVDDLIHLSKNPHFWDKNLYFSLSAHIDLQEYEFTPIGYQSIPFNGFFQGNGYSIKNLAINLPEIQGVGLFGWLSEGAEIESVTLSNTNIVGYDDCGAICGCNEGGKIKSCEVVSATIKCIYEIPQEDLSIGICVGANYDNGLVYACIGNAKLITPYKEYTTDNEESIIGFNNANFVA
jgi:hypothetical protein